LSGLLQLAIYCMVSLTACFDDYSRRRTPQRASFPVHGGRTT